MKKLLFTTIIGLLTTFHTEAQFYDQDAQFHSEYYHLGMYEGYASTSILSDTTINGQATNRLEWSAEYWQVNGPGWGNGERVDEGVVDRLLTYKSNDSVFVYRDGGFHLAFKTDGNQGDIWDLGQFPQLSNWQGITDDHAYLKVVSALNTVINGELLRVLTVEPCKQDVGYGGEINERMGPSVGLLYLSFAYPSDLSDAPRTVNTLCYNSTNLGMVDFDTDVDCMNDIASAGVNDLSAIGAIQVYPNPNTGTFNVSFDGAAAVQSITVFDLSGRMIQTINVNEIEQNWTIQDLSKGIYNIILRSANIQSTPVRVVVE
ncbi:unnamed protein product [Chrysoparadoxa australica]